MVDDLGRSLRHLRIARAVGLGLAAIYCLTRGIAYLPGQTPDHLPGALDLITEFLPLTFWAIAWFAAGSVAAAFAAVRQLSVAMGPTATMAGIWGFAYLLAWVQSVCEQDPSREYLNALSYLFPCGLAITWIAVARGPRIETKA